MKRLIIDGENLYYRAYWVASNQYKDNSRMCIHVFLNILRSYTRIFLPDQIIITWDYREPGFVNERKEIDSEYKANRVHDPKVHEHVDELKEVIKSLGICQINPREREGDDILYWLCAVKYPNECVLISTDTDLYQMIVPKLKDNVVWNPTKKEIVDTTYLIMHYDVKDGFEFIIKKALRGDSSDNIQGIKGLRSTKIKEITKVLTRKMNFDALRESNLLTEEQLERFKTNTRLMMLSSIKENQREMDFYQSQLDNNTKSDYDQFRTLLEQYGLEKMLSKADDWFYWLAQGDKNSDQQDDPFENFFSGIVID